MLNIRLLFVLVSSADLLNLVQSYHIKDIFNSGHKISNSFSKSLSSVVLISTFLNPIEVQAVPYDAFNYLNKGVASFKELHIKESISWFDKAELAYPEIANKLWQRGIAEYLNGDYTKCYSQFSRDIALNAKDTEEAVWSIMCAYRQDSLTGSLTPDDVVTKHKALLPKAIELIAKESRTEQDSRPIMRQVYALFTDAAIGSIKGVDMSESPSLATLESISTQQANSPTATFSNSAYFYANLYLSLYKDMIDDSIGTKLYADKALETQYAKTNQNNDYMISVARALQQKQEMNRK